LTSNFPRQAARGAQRCVSPAILSDSVPPFTGAEPGRPHWYGPNSLGLICLLRWWRSRAQLPRQLRLERSLAEKPPFGEVRHCGHPPRAATAGVGARQAFRVPNEPTSERRCSGAREQALSAAEPCPAKNAEAAGIFVPGLGNWSIPAVRSRESYWISAWPRCQIR